MRDHRTISIADQIFDQLQYEILSGKYKKGEILSETRLSADLGVSRTPVREAIRRLEQDHILVDTGRGSEVVGISHDDVMDMYDLRLQIEGQAAARAARNISGGTLDRMKDILDLQKFYIDQPDDKPARDENIKDQDSRFHEELYKATGSVIYYDVLTSIHRKIMMFRKASIVYRSRARESYEEHQAILDALATHEPELARAAAVKHIINARDNIRTKIIMQEQSLSRQDS